MLLEELLMKTERVHQAMKDGIQTTEEYEVWLIGYMAGYRDRQAEIMESIKE